MATRPPRNPFTEMPRSHFLVIGYTRSTADMPPAHAAIVVLAATRPIPSQSIAESVEPGLNPYQPNQRMTPPMAPQVRSCAGIGPPPSRLNVRPRRGPRAIAPARAIMPPTVCTTVEPAKSRKKVPPVPNALKSAPLPFSNQPPGPHTQCPKIGYMNPDTHVL